MEHPVFSLRKYLLPATLALLLLAFFFVQHSTTIAQTTSSDIVCTLAPTAGGITSPVTLPTGGPVESEALIGGQTFTISCKNKYDTDTALTGTAQAAAGIIARPDLTANPPIITCEERMRLGTDVNGVQKCHKGSTLSISGSLNNIGTAPTPNGTFTSVYQYATDGKTWNPLAETTLVDSSPFGAAGTPSASNRALKPYAGTSADPWVAGYSLAPDYYWYFRVCADSNNAVTTEAIKTNNCSSPARLKVLGLKPHVELYISPVGQPCMTRRQKTTVILKGQPATLCWKVTAEEVTL